MTNDLYFFFPYLSWYTSCMIPHNSFIIFISELCYTFLFYSFNCKHAMGETFARKFQIIQMYFQIKSRITYLFLIVDMENLLILGFVPVYHSRRKPLLQRSFSTTSYYCSSDNENIVNAEPTEQEEDYHSIIKDTERSKGELRCNFYWI